MSPATTKPSNVSLQQNSTDGVQLDKHPRGFHSGKRGNTKRRVYVTYQLLHDHYLGTDVIHWKAAYKHKLCFQQGVLDKITNALLSGRIFTLQKVELTPIQYNVLLQVFVLLREVFTLTHLMNTWNCCKNLSCYWSASVMPFFRWSQASIHLNQKSVTWQASSIYEQCLGIFRMNRLLNLAALKKEGLCLCLAW